MRYQAVAEARAALASVAQLNMELMEQRHVFDQSLLQVRREPHQTATLRLPAAWATLRMRRRAQLSLALVVS